MHLLFFYYYENMCCSFSWSFLWLSNLAIKIVWILIMWHLFVCDLVLFLCANMLFRKWSFRKVNMSFSALFFCCQDHFQPSTIPFYYWYNYQLYPISIYTTFKLCSFLHWYWQTSLFNFQSIKFALLRSPFRIGPLYLLESRQYFNIIIVNCNWVE